MQTSLQARRVLSSFATRERAIGSARFFKTGKGQYGYGDKFIGVTVPDTRKVARQYAQLSFGEIEKLLSSKVHEERLLALIILVNQYKGADGRQKNSIYEFYMGHLFAINNWDLVDTSAPYIVGEYMHEHQEIKKQLKVLVRSSRLWERRVAVLSTLTFIRKGSSKEIFELAEMLLSDKHDLMHKAVGWMLREVGRCISHAELRKFLDMYAAVMPRTTLRYALEHFSPKDRLYYMKKHTLS